MKTHQPFNQMPAAQQAGILCNDPEFRKFTDAQTTTTGDASTITAAAEFVRTTCQIKSRSELNTDSQAAAKFAALRTDFDAWAGRIAAPRDGDHQ